MDTNEKFYTLLPLRHERFSYEDRINHLIYAVREAVYCNRKLLVPQIELSKKTNFGVPVQSELGDYFNLQKTAIDCGQRKTRPLVFINSDQWPDTSRCTVANLMPDEPLSKLCPQQLVVRYLPADKTYFPPHYAHSIKTSRSQKLWRHPDYEKIKIRFEPAPKWQEMADRTIERLGGAKQYWFLSCTEEKPADKPGKQTTFYDSGILKKICSHASAQSIFYLKRDRLSPQARQFCDSAMESLKRNHHLCSYKDFPDLQGLIETTNPLLLDNHGLILVERLIKESARRELNLCGEPKT